MPDSLQVYIRSTGLCHLLTWLFSFQLLESTVYGERKGAAYGLAGLVKGLGILYLKQLNIMSTLQEAIQDKKNYRHREGKANHCNTCKCAALFSLSKSL